MSDQRRYRPAVRAAKGFLTSIRELADWDEADWKKIIGQKVNGKPVGFPPDTPGGNEEEQMENYARALVQGVEKAEPTAVFSARFAKHGIAGMEAVKQTLDVFFAGQGLKRVIASMAKLEIKS